MYIFKANDWIAKVMYNDYFILCSKYVGNEFHDYVLLSVLPTRVEAEMIMRLVHRSKCPLVGLDSAELIEFKGE